MKNIARTSKSKSLLNTPSSRPKKQDKYSDKPTIKQEYKHKIDDNVVYVGSLDDYHGLECKIAKRSHRKSTEYYSIQFNDGEIIRDIGGGFLRTLEEYENEQKQINKNIEENNNLSEYEIELNKQGIESHHNYTQCLVPNVLYEMRCHECDCEKKCVYRNKYNYKKFRNL